MPPAGGAAGCHRYRTPSCGVPVPPEPVRALAGTGRAGTARTGTSGDRYRAGRYRRREVPVRAAVPVPVTGWILVTGHRYRLAITGQDGVPGKTAPADELRDHACPRDTRVGRVPSPAGRQGTGFPHPPGAARRPGPRSIFESGHAWHRRRSAPNYTVRTVESETAGIGVSVGLPATRQLGTQLASWVAGPAGWTPVGYGPDAGWVGGEPSWVPVGRAPTLPHRKPAPSWAMGGREHSQPGAGATPAHDHTTAPT
jgi:hypothetical protein